MNHLIKISLFTLPMLFCSFSLLINDWKQISMQEYERILDKGEKFYKEKKYSVKYKISSFKTHQEIIPYETAKGFVIRQNESFHNGVLGVHSIQNEKYRFVIDSIQRYIMIANPVDPESYETILNNIKLWKKQIITVKQLVTDQGMKLNVRFNENLRTESMTLEFNKEGFLKKSTVYFRIQLSHDPTDKNSIKTAPRVETEYSEYKTSLTEIQNRSFDEKKYFIYSEKGFTPTQEYKSFKVKDTRYSTK